MSALQAPVKVAPLIKFARWSLLSAGVVYGAFHHRRFSRKEAAIREIEERERPAREAKIAAEKKLLSDNEIKELEAVISPVPK